MNKILIKRTCSIGITYVKEEKDEKEKENVKK